MNRGGPLNTSQDLLVMLRRFLAEPGPSRFADETLYGFIDLATHEVSEDTGSAITRLTINVAANQNTYDTQSDLFHFVSIIGVRFYPDPADSANFRVLEWVSPEEMEHLRGSVTGIPSRYSFYEKLENLGGPSPFMRQDLVLYPTPSQAGLVEITATVLAATPSAAERPTERGLIRRAWRDLVIQKALAYAYENLGRPDMAQEKERRYQEMLSGVRLRLLNYTTSNYEHVFDAHRFGYV